MNSNEFEVTLPELAKVQLQYRYLHVMSFGTTFNTQPSHRGIHYWL